MKWLISFAVSLLASACGGSSVAPAAGDNGTAVWPSNATELVIASDGGGFSPQPPAGSTCQSGEAMYTFTVSTRNLAWEECGATADGSYARRTGARILSQAEADGVIQAVRRVTPSASTSCGADKAALFLDVTTPEGEHHYLDDFYACSQAGAYVTGLDELRSATAALAY